MIRSVNKLKEFAAKNAEACDKALERMAGDIVKVAKIRVPFEHGHLMKSIKASRIKPLHHRVVVDSDYAAYQERGMRRNGSHVVRRYSTPGTGAHYLRDAGRSISDKALNYLKQAANSIRL